MVAAVPTEGKFVGGRAKRGQRVEETENGP